MILGLLHVLRRTEKRTNKPMRKLHESLDRHFTEIVALGKHHPPTGRIEASTTTGRRSCARAEVTATSTTCCSSCASPSRTRFAKPTGCSDSKPSGYQCLTAMRHPDEHPDRRPARRVRWDAQPDPEMHPA